MANFIGTLAISSIAALSLISCETAAVGNKASGTVSSFSPTDSRRNVLSFADVLEPVLPSVVRVGRLNRAANGRLGLGGLGSGAVIDAENGYIITNAHVVADGDAYLVDLPDGRVVDAKLIGIDTPTDIAVLQADDLRVGAVTLANSDDLRVGDVVFAVGYPLGLDQSLSLGVVSGLGRTSSRDGLQDFIQTDAAINSGNSGGPLLDSLGRLVGINTAIVSKSGGSNGIGFSVPVGLAAQVTDQLIKYGEVRRGSIGVRAGRVSEEVSEKIGIDHWDGAYITELRPGGPAATAGLQLGDVITKYDGKVVKTPSALRAWVGVAEADSRHRVSFIRANGIEQTTEVIVGNSEASLVAGLEELGASIRPLVADDNPPPDIRGVYVYAVEKGSPADRAGLVVGDIIGGINNEETTTMAESNALVKESKGRARLLVYRHGAAILVIVEP